MDANKENAKPMDLPHGEMVRMGPVRVKVLCVGVKGPRGKVLGTELEVGGVLRLYKPLNLATEQFWAGREGKTFTVIAEGAGVDAVLTYVGERVAEPGPEPPSGVNPDRVVVPTCHRDPATRAAVNFVARRATLLKVCLLAARRMQEDLGTDKLSPEHFQTAVSSLFISADRAGLAEKLPPRVAWPTLESPATPTERLAAEVNAADKSVNPETEPAGEPQF
jgi:hypothetical protein